MWRVVSGARRQSVAVEHPAAELAVLSDGDRRVVEGSSAVSVELSGRTRVVGSESSVAAGSQDMPSAAKNVSSSEALSMVMAAIGPSEWMG